MKQTRSGVSVRRRIVSGRVTQLGVRAVCTVGLCLALAVFAQAQPLALDAVSLTSGGGAAEESSLRATLAVGQPTVGLVSAGALTIELGVLAGGAQVNVSNDADVTPLRFDLGANYPNPFARSTDIAYELPEATVVRLEVFDVLGRRVRTLVDGEQSAGRHAASFAVGGLASGVYLYRLTAGARTATRQMQVIR